MNTDKNFQVLAINMFSQGKTIDQVIEMLKHENHDPASAESMALRFRRDYEGLKSQQKRELKKAIKSDQLIGGLSLGTGTVVTLLSYLFLDSVFFVFYGLIGGGIFYLGRSYVNQRNLDDVDESSN